MKISWKIILLLLLTLLMVISFQQIYSKHHVEAVDVIIKPGAASSHIARDLMVSGVISSQWQFELLARLTGKTGSLKVGQYRFAGELSLLDVLKKIEAGDVVQFQVTIPEGLRTVDVLLLLAEKTGVDAELWHSAMTELLSDEEWEGRLLPESYRYSKPVIPKKMLAQMLAAQESVLKSIVTATMPAEKLRIIASIIEKETSVDAERALVSAAIYNRLRIGMPLQMDPTVIYGIWRRDGSFSGNIRRKDLSSDTPWNSYTRRGLPPTPISNPGASSLRAAASPADVPYLYFVADGTGGHAFATTYEEHRANVKSWVNIEREKNRKIENRQQ